MAIDVPGRPALARDLSEADLAEIAVYPRLSRIRDVSHAVAVAVIRRAISEGHASPVENIEMTVREAMWFPEYLPIRFEPAGAVQSAAWSSVSG